MKDYGSWQPVIGLEIHAQLNTKTKLFSPAPNKFGDEPNCNIHEICTGQPGSLPVLNEKAIYKAVQFGLAIEADIQNYSKFDRKSYFYPDSPRNFQITQFENPIIKNGKIEIEIDEKIKKIEISSAHIEDDAGMLKHFSTFSAIDYNRAGAALLEIISKPMIHSPKEASLYAFAIKEILEYINASDCNMEKGHLRIDANVSIRKKEETNLRCKVEIKNINSFSYLEKSLEKEISRQISIYNQNKNDLIKQETYRWDSQKKENVLMRTKESSHDYRYFPEPDLPPIILTAEYIQKAKDNLAELPRKRFKRYIEKLKLSSYDANILVKNKRLSDYFETALSYTKNPKLLVNLITVEILGKLEKDFLLFEIPAKHVGILANLIDKNSITGKIAKKIIDDMIQNPKKDPNTIIKENPDYIPIKDTSFIEPIVDKVIKENPNSIEDFKKGKTRALSYLVGQVMKLTKGKASPKIVNELILKKLT